MSEEELLARLLSDLTAISLPVNEVDVFIRPYSKSFYGRYFPVKDEKKTRPKMYIYPYERGNKNFMSYKVIFETCVHEFCHHIQYCDSSFVRKSGIMHNVQFWKLYNHYIERATRLGIIEKEVNENKDRKTC